MSDTKIDWKHLQNTPIGTMGYVKRMSRYVCANDRWERIIRDRVLLRIIQIDEALIWFVTPDGEECTVTRSPVGYINFYNHQDEFYCAHEFYMIDSILSNKDRKNCFKCGCNTQMKIDFSDMTIREMCPRCKI